MCARESSDIFLLVFRLYQRVAMRLLLLSKGTVRLSQTESVFRYEQAGLLESW